MRKADGLDDLAAKLPRTEALALLKAAEAQGLAVLLIITDSNNFAIRSTDNASVEPYYTAISSALSTLLTKSPKEAGSRGYDDAGNEIISRPKKESES